jgi:Domain of unknown function (DUF4262)
MVRESGLDEPERKVLANIAKFGWHCTNILAEGALPQYSFTIGFFQTWKYPELLVMELKSTVAHALLQIVARALREGKRFDLEALDEDLLNDYACCSVQVPKSEYREHVGFARWYYEGDEFPLYQIIWPSKEGHFPWNRAARLEYKCKQKVLGQPGAKSLRRYISPVIERHFCADLGEMTHKTVGCERGGGGRYISPVLRLTY